MTAALLAFTAGFVDTCGFIALFGLFTAHVTGNFVLIGAALAGHHAGIIGKLLAFPVFILAVALTHLFVLHHRRISRHTARWVLAGQILFLLLFLAVGVEAAPFAAGNAPMAILTGMMGVIAMAIQNAASRTVLASLAPTTVMTGNVTQIVIDLVEIAHPMPNAQKRSRGCARWCFPWRPLRWGRSPARWAIASPASPAWRSPS